MRMAESRVVEFPFFEGRTRHLKFDFNGILEIEDRSGKNPMEFVGNIMQMSAKNIRLALWVGLKHEEARNVKKVVTEPWVGEQLQKHLDKGQSLIPILRTLDEAFSICGYFAAEAPKEDGASDPPAPALTAVGSSGTSGATMGASGASGTGE